MNKEIRNLAVTNDERTLIIMLIHQECQRIEKEDKRPTTTDFRKKCNKRLYNELRILLDKVVILFSRGGDTNGEDN